MDYINHEIEHEKEQLGKIKDTLCRDIITNKHFKHINRDILSNKKFIDIGCGSGLYVRWSAENYSRYSAGIDISFDKINYYNKKKMIFDGNSVDLPENAFFIIGDMQRDLPLKNSTFDVVGIFQALHHYSEDNINFFFKEAKRLSKSGGYLIISDPNGDHFLRKIGNAIGRYMNFMTPNECAFGKNKIIETAAKYGYVLEHIKGMNYTAEIIHHLALAIDYKYPFLGNFVHILEHPCIFIDNFLERFYKLSLFFGWRLVFVFKMKE
ncbi:class I SAM-dependent methyltransferase [Candidatus Dependentiae bacterium]|nr:class I SAM-dependent methyltransferase [Candidatus Dependentiae bacterium]